MTPITTLPVFAAATLALGIGLPLVRTWRRDGTFALVRPRGALQRFVHGAFSGALLAWGAFTAVLVAVGPESLGVVGLPGGLAWVGPALAGLGLLLVITAQAQMGRSWRIGIPEEPTALVTHGVFRMSRNPIYLGMFVIAGGITLTAPCAWTVMGLVLTWVLVEVQARAEEAALLADHGAAYRDWAGRVGRFVPGLGLGVDG